MKGIPHKKPGYFPTPPGTCFIMPELPYPDGTPADGGNAHPFIVLSDESDYVEVIMGQTLYCESERKDRGQLEFTLDGFAEIRRPHPPMDPIEKRRQYTNTAEMMILPKQVLYESRHLTILNDGGMCLDKNEVRRLKSLASKESLEPYAVYSDPYDYDNYEQDMGKWIPKDTKKTERKLPDISGIKYNTEQDETQISPK